VKGLHRPGRLAWAAVVVAVVIGATACGSGGSSGSSSGGAGGSSPASSSAPSTSIGLVTDIGGLNDRSFNHLAFLGVQRAG
jgi:basic membrane protein A and related proteins